METETRPDDFVLWNGDASQAPSWTSGAADGSKMAVAAEPHAPGAALRLDFDLVGPTSWVIARREVHFTLPEHYVVVLRVRGRSAPNQLQVKIVDPTGANVWWWRLSNHVFTPDTDVLVLRKDALEFAWGPLSGGDPLQVAAVEVALAPGTGGPGTVWIEEFRFEPRDGRSAHPKIHAVTASSACPTHDPSRTLDEGGNNDWKPDASDGEPWLQIDLGLACEFGGVVLDFAQTPPAGLYRLLASDDAAHWRTVVEREHAACPRLWLRTDDGEGRYARVEFPKGSSPYVVHLGIVPLVRSVSPQRYITRIARAEPRGMYPRHVAGEQGYWAVVGADGDDRKGLLGEDGALEVAFECYSIEPFLRIDGKLVTWAGADKRCWLADGHLPVPSVEWVVDGVRMLVTAFAIGEAGASTLVARYDVECDPSRDVKLYLAIRPFQVNPCWQSLQMSGGVAPIDRISRRDAVISVGDMPPVLATTRFDAFCTLPSEDGLRTLADGRLPARQDIADPLGFASAVLSYDCATNGSVTISVPLHGGGDGLPAWLDRDEAKRWSAARLVETVERWRTRLACIPIELPPCAEAFSNTLRASVAWILVNREGPRIQPGPRCYRRSWIRDGTLTGTTLAEMGFGDEAMAFLRWYAPYQLENGRIPAVVDRHGVDPMPEHDSHGQFIWGIAELYRLTGDRGFLERMWPRLRRAADAIEALRAERTTESYEDQPTYGLLPESISHEGYVSRPVHSYWDSFFGLLGLEDAADMAAIMGETGIARHFAAVRNAMRKDVHLSIERTIRIHGIDYLPGAAELGDFDPTSSAILLDPCGEMTRLPRPELENTFERYWQEFANRRRGETKWTAYTAYEVRNAVALMMIGRKQDAYELLEWMIDDQRPPAWHQWPEVSTHEPRLARFVGDLPHGWIASSFVRAVRRMIAQERFEDGALLIAPGVPATWVTDAPGIVVRSMPTHAGILDFTMRAENDGTVHVTIGSRLRWPSAGVVVEWPLDGDLGAVTVDGRPQEPSHRQRHTLRRPAGELVMRSAAAA